MPKICGLTTQSNTIAAFMLKPFNVLAERGFECYCISGPDVNSRLNKDNLGAVTHIPVQIKWGYMTPWDIISTVYRLFKIFRKEKFDVIQYATMNAALCASIAGWLARVPVRIDLLWGLDYVMFKGWKRWLYYSSTKLICALSTNVQPDSKGNLKFGLETGLFTEKQAGMIFNGSACGLDLKKFDIAQKEVWRNEVRKEVGLEKYKKIFGFVGSITYDKGMNELLEAFMNLGRSDVALVLVGGLSKKPVGLNQEIFNKAQEQSNIYFLGRKNDPQRYFAAYDYLMLPSYAEGFGMVVLEAAGVGTPSIISNIKGPTDFVKDGINGIVCEPKSVSSLQSALERAIELPEQEYRKLANSAYEIVKRDFDSSIFLQKYVENRIELYEKSKK